MEKKLPLISCVCPTLGKWKHLEEAIHSFLIQTYPNKELIIFNNYPNVDFILEHPQITIINYKEDIVSIGQCRNVSNSYAKGDWIVVWDDDDISLSKRLEYGYQNCISQNKLAYIANAYYSEKNMILKKLSLFLSSSFIHRSVIEKYPYPFVDAEDQAMFQTLKENHLLCGDEKVYDPQYIYRWATGTYHVSGNPLPIQEQRKQLIEWTDSLKFPSIIYLNPHWERDYEKDAREYIAI
jgi:glycosyltransferase involved in cell wall biosynthesis